MFAIEVNSLRFHQILSEGKAPLQNLYVTDSSVASFIIQSI